ncbi:MAG: hypothetical protein JEZ02_16045 [Desulfatibacillum sp.]|nr:hypothetical protein [Desulfatibacillum sp.]
MSETEFTLTGWKAIVAVIIAVAVGGYSLVMRNATLDTQARDVISTWIAAEYASKALTKWEGADYAQNPQLAEQSAEEILAATRVTIPSIKAKGSKREPIVRVKILVDGQPPADGKGTRYYKMKFSPMTGWTMGHKVTAFSYYTKLF